MPATNIVTPVWPTLRQVVAVDVGTQSRTGRSEANWRHEWQELIEERLIEWGRNSSEVEDDEMPMPSRTTVGVAIQVARKLRDQGDPPPTRIAPDAHGGIVFEHQAGPMFESVRISADNSVEHCLFKDCRMLNRELWPLEIFVSE